MYICAITVLEIQRGISLAAHRGDELLAAMLNRWLENVVLPAFAGRILPVDHMVAGRGSATAVGRCPGLPRPDPRCDGVGAWCDCRDAQHQALRGVRGAVGESLGTSP
jgi:predicted nucleic acid-binding protein